MRPSDQQRAGKLRKSLLDYSTQSRNLPGIHLPGHLDVLVEQIIDSLRRIEFVHWIKSHPVDPQRMNPHSDLFDPLRASVLCYRSGDTDEAFWLVFLATHFGKHSHDKWRLMRDIYGQLGGPGIWDWKTTSVNPNAFRRWLVANHAILRGDGIQRRFSNHRKYESIDPKSRGNTADVIESYIAWVGPPRTHQELIRDTHKIVGQNPKDTFGYLYNSMKTVIRFGRLAKFDYLTMLGKLDLAPIDPDSAYLSEATGPLKGAKLLFGGNGAMSPAQLDTELNRLDAQLNVGMQVLEDSLCNWQKSPDKFISFRG